MNWSLIIFGLVALSSAAFAKDSYLVIVPKLFKVNYENQFSIFIASASQPVEVKFDLTLGSKRIEGKTICKPGETRNATMVLPEQFPIGAAELTITGTGGLQFQEKRDVIIYDNRHAILVQTSASTYRPLDIMELRVIATTEEFMPLESGMLDIEIYDAALKLVGEFPRVPIRSGLTETLRFPIGEDCNVGGWLVSATLGNTTSSVEVLVTRPVSPSFDLKAIFQRFLLRSDKVLRGVIEMSNDQNEPIFGRGLIAIGQMTEEEYDAAMKHGPHPPPPPPKGAHPPPPPPKGAHPPPPPKEEEKKSEDWRKWKSQKIEIAGRVELNYDLMSTFEIDLSKTLAVQVYIQITDLLSGEERVIRHLIPVFTRDVIYEIRPLQFEAGIKNEYSVMAKRPDGKPIQMEDVIVTIRMMLGNEEGKKPEEKVVEIKDFYTRGRNDMGLFNIDFPENCIGVLMTVTPVGSDGKIHGYRTVTIPMMPTPRRSPAKLSIELLPSTAAPAHTDVNVPVVSSQLSTVGRTSNFYIQLIPSKPVQKFERLPMSYVLMTNGRITRTGEFHIAPSKECQGKATRTMKPEEQMPPTCVFNGTLPIPITWDMVPYSTLLVYTFQPSFGFNVAETYRFSVAGLFRQSMTLNATIVPYTATETVVDDFRFMPDMQTKPIRISDKAHDKSRVELSFTGTPESTVGLNVFEFDGVFQGLSNEITKERLLRYLTTYEQVPIVSMPTMPTSETLTRRQRQVAGGPGMMAPNAGMTGGMANGMAGGMPGGMAGGMTGDMAGGMAGGMAGSPGVMAGGMATGMAGVPGNMGGHPSMVRRAMSEEDERRQHDRERKGYEARYPVEKMVFGVHSGQTLLPVEGDDIYVSSKMGRLYGDMQQEESLAPQTGRQFEKTNNQFDVSVNGNDYVLATSVPLVFTKTTPPMPPKPMPPKKEKDINVEKESMYEHSPEFGTRRWYEQMNSKLNAFTLEAFKFMQSGLSIVSDFDSLRIPAEMKRENLSNLFNKFRMQSAALLERPTYNVRDEARELLEGYIGELDLSLVPPPVVFEEQSRTGYYRSIFFNTSRIESQGTGKVVLPKTKPYSTWMATGFALNAKSGLSIAQPIRLPTNQGLFVLGNCAKHARVGEHILLTFGINNYLEKEISNVMFRIRASPDFDLVEQSKPETIVSSKDKDYTMTIPSMKSFGVETRNLVLIPKRRGLIQIVLEVESQFGGDYEILNMFVNEATIERIQLQSGLYVLTNEKKNVGPIVEKIEEPSTLQSVEFAVSGTFLDQSFYRDTLMMKSFVGIDETLTRLYRTLAFRRYLNETSQMQSPYFNLTADNATTDYQALQAYNDYDGSYSFISTEGTRRSSLYLTSLAFGAMASPMMPVRDLVALNRTLSWILSRQQEDGSFDDNGPCFHYRFCAGEFRRESLTAIVLYSLTRDNSSMYMPEFLYRRLFAGENSPVMRAQRYLESRVPEVKSNPLIISLFEMAFTQNNKLSSELRSKIHETLLARKLTVDPKDASKYWKLTADKMSFDDELLANAINGFLYSYFGDFQTAMDMSRWVAQQFKLHPHMDTVLDAIFHSDSWYALHCLMRKQFPLDKVDITIDISIDNGMKKEFKINGSNLDRTQMVQFTAPIRQLTYSVRGFGLCGVIMIQRYIVKEQQKSVQPSPFKLTQEFRPMSWLNEIKAKTCVTYTPTTQTQQMAKDTFNRTIVVEIELPSGMRLNVRQLGFFLTRNENVMEFDYNQYFNKLSIFLNVPSNMSGKNICLDWCLERLSSVVNWAPIAVRVYDYLQPETELIQLIPIQIQPSLLGYSFVDAVHKARPALSSLPLLQKQQEL